MPRFLLISLFVMTSLGCSGRTSVAPTVNLQSGANVKTPEASDHGEILVWVRQVKGDQTRTYRLASEGPLQILGQQDGVLLATSHGELAWVAKDQEVKLDGCEHVDGSPAVPTTGSVTTANLVNKTGQIIQKIVEPNTDTGSDIDELQHHAGLVASIGPYLFIHESSYVYACGAHGNEMSSALIWDAESGKTIDLWSQLPNKGKLIEDAKRKLDSEDEEPAAEDESAIPEPAQFVPVYGDRGALRLDAQFARWACYACGDHEWSSYTRSAVVPTNWMPERMRPWVTPPVVVKEFLETHQEWRLGGWSKR